VELFGEQKDVEKRKLYEAGGSKRKVFLLCEWGEAKFLSSTN
jgi:hypothetical protein